MPDMHDLDGTAEVVEAALDAADRVTTVQNVTGGGDYASSIGYTPAGDPTSMKLGNGVIQSYTWNDRLQPTGVTAATSGGTTLLGLGLYPCGGNATSCASGNNGNLQSQTIAMPGLNLTQTYSYDHLNRLTQAQEGPTTGGSVNWTQTYGYDVLGNFWVSSNTGLPSLGLQTPQSSSWYSTTVPNRFAASTGWAYDSNGNVLQVGQMARSFTYDGENRQVTACLNCAQGSPTATYQYDGLGQRVSKTTGGAVTTYVYDAFGNLAAEYSTGAMPSACGTPTCYVTADHLGSTRMLTSSAGAVGSRYDYQPFGQEIPAGYDGRLTSMGYLAAADATNPKFTGQERDQETTLDNSWCVITIRRRGGFRVPILGMRGPSSTFAARWRSQKSLLQLLQGRAVVGGGCRDRSYRRVGCSKNACRRSGSERSPQRCSSRN